MLVASDFYVWIMSWSIISPDGRLTAGNAYEGDREARNRPPGRLFIVCFACLPGFGQLGVERVKLGDSFGAVGLAGAISLKDGA